MSPARSGSSPPIRRCSARAAPEVGLERTGDERLPQAGEERQGPGEDDLGREVDELLEVAVGVIPLVEPQGLHPFGEGRAEVGVVGGSHVRPTLRPVSGA